MLLAEQLLLPAGRAGKASEAAWRSCHKAAAQRLAQYCGDLPYQPPLQPLLRAARYCSIAAGVAVEGQPLCGMPCSGGGLLAGASANDGAGAGAQLQLACSVSQPQDAAATGKGVHQGAGLSRAQLLQLFTGSTQGVNSAAAMAADAGNDSTQLQQQRQVGYSRSDSRSGNTAGGSTAAAALISLSGSGKHKQHAGAPVVVQVSTFTPPASGCCSEGPATPRHTSSECGSEQLQLVAEVLPRQQQQHAKTSKNDRQAGFEQQQQQQGARQMRGTAGSRPAGAAAATATAAAPDDPLSFLDGLPLYGQQDHSGALGVAVGVHTLTAADMLQLGARAVYLLVVFAPFLLLGVPMLLLALLLLRRAAEQQQDGQQQQDDAQQQEWQLADGDDGSERSWRPRQAAARLLAALSAAAARLLQQLLMALECVGALLDLLLVLLLGGHWHAGVSAWTTAGLYLRSRAWRLLLFSCSHSGAAFIKWGQWSASRRDLFPCDFCDTLSALHDR